MQPYYVRDSMLDPSERSLFRALYLVICQRALIFIKVDLRDLLAASDYTPAIEELSPVANRRVDFVVCERNMMRPMAVLLIAEPPTGDPLALDVANDIANNIDNDIANNIDNDIANNIDNDIEKDGNSGVFAQIKQLCTTAGLPVITLEKQATYCMNDLSPLLEPILASNSIGDDFTQGERAFYAEEPSVLWAARRSTLTKSSRKSTPAYPGYGALKVIANKLS